MSAMALSGAPTVAATGGSRTTAGAVPGDAESCGGFAGILGEDGRVRTASGAIEVLEIQMLGGKPMAFEVFARGRRGSLGMRLTAPTAS